MKKIFWIILFSLLNVDVISQICPATYTNYELKDSLKINDVLVYWDGEIQEIILSPNNEFTFVNRPMTSCLSWKYYKGKWELKNDTIIFTEQIEIEEKDVVFSFSNDHDPVYKINFETDRKSKLKNKEIEIKFIYDFDSDLKEVTIKKKLDKDFNLQIPFNEVPNRENLASVKFEYLLRRGDKRIGYITDGHVVNRKENDLQNIIEVTFIEKPRKEMIFRKTIGVLMGNKIIIISSEKSKSSLPDYSDELYFKDFYLEI